MGSKDYPSLDEYLTSKTGFKTKALYIEEKVNEYLVTYQYSLRECCGGEYTWGFVIIPKAEFIALNLGRAV